MELHGMNFPDSVFHCSDSVFRFAGGAESAWHGKHAVTVAVPYLKFYRQAFEKFRAVTFEFCLKLGAAVFAALYRLHSAAENAGNPLHAVADTKDWNSSGQDRGITFRSVLVVDRTWAAGEHDAGGFERANFGNAGATRKDGAKNLLLANAAGNELGVLPAKIEDDNTAQFGFRLGIFFLHFHRVDTDCSRASLWVPPRKMSGDYF
jgi:hypothetical protein